MKDYDELVKALRDKYMAYDATGNHKSAQLFADAADAIELLRDKYYKAETDATNLTGRLAQAEADVERLKDVIDELREAQTYIDHYGDKWRTSAKDVPTSAYNHGYMDGKNEAEQALEPKRGEWINHKDEHQCSVCRETVVVDEVRWEQIGEYDYCPNCGAKMEGMDASRPD